VGISIEELARYSAAVTESVPTERVRNLVEAVRLNMERPRLSISDYGSVLNAETASLPLIIRKAMAERRMLSVAPVGIWDGQLFAGCYTFNDGRPGNAKLLPEYATESERVGGEKNGFGIYSIFGHLSPDYPRLLRLGTSGIRSMATAALNREPLTDKSRYFLQATLISLEGLEIFAKRHAVYVREMAGNESDAKRRAELIRTAEALERCPEHPASSYFEACQASWLLHLAMQLAGCYLALGRPDQYLAVYLEQDLASGRITLAEAQEITDCWMLKFNERAQDGKIAAKTMDVASIQDANDQKWRKRKITDNSQQRFNVRDGIDATNHWLQNVVIGGVQPEDGRDATNYVTVMILESHRRLRMTNPVLSVRLHKGSPEWFVRQVAITLKTGGGMPAIYNDEVIIRAYTQFGIDEQDARDYANNGCWEVILPGRTDFYFIKLNALKCLEWSLNHGICHVDGKQEVPDQGDPAGFESFDMLFDKVMENFRLLIEADAADMAARHPLRSSIAPTPLLSAMLDGPVEKGCDMTDMGARFIIGGIIAEGMSHLIDSLIAIEQWVYQDRKYSMTKLVEAINADFLGYPVLQADFARCPKYGSGDPVADAMGRRVIETYGQLVREVDAKTASVRIMPGVGTFSWYIAVGEGTGASADGRRLGEPVSSNFSPSAGAMINGITGAIRSYCHMAQDLLPIGSPIDLGLSERHVAGEAGTVRLAGLLKSFLAMNGNLMTLSVADVETLREAQRHPDKYRDLRVRMGGWSAYFTMLSKEQQDHHIKKSEAGFFA
jgi:formate C-acetyltransferase